MIFSFIAIQSNRIIYKPNCYYIRCLSTSTDPTRPEFPAENAYDILGVSETSSFADIKASFRKLAKETHPDLADSDDDSTAASQRFVRVLAAYEILSDSEKRAHYDRYLLSQREIVERHSRPGQTSYMYNSRMTMSRQMEVVEWLRWYRLAIHDILSEKKVVVATGYFDALEADFYSAVHAAYYGPGIESMDLLPDCFEAEERSVYDTPEVLHLVSGRDLFGMVCLANKNPELSSASTQKLSSSVSVSPSIFQSTENVGIFRNCNVSDDGGIMMHARNGMCQISDAYKDLELHVCGRLVALASRTPPKSACDGIQNKDGQDRIHVYLSTDNDSLHISRGFPGNSFSGGVVGSRIPLGTISGLGTSPEEGSCLVHDNSGRKTHMIMKHRTLLVKHLHWYGVGNKASVCECRCTRAKLPPSKFWLFEPRCGVHDIGGWYVETFGKDKKGHTVHCQRYWDGFDGTEQNERRLHPAIYLLALAYRTLDIEDAKRRKQTVRNIVERQLFRVIHWCKRFI
uniref:Uncharacterized protein LOC105639813 n=3 Tax=Rhizophora mucronata TaxID=61149 RepID=A0A2P2KWJ9_RHIMU